MQQSSPEDQENPKPDAEIPASNFDIPVQISLHQTDPLRQLEPTILSSLNSTQIQAIQNLISQTICSDQNQKYTDSKSSQHPWSTGQELSAKKQRSKLIDIRFVIDLIFSRFYVVLLVGKDIRKGRRQYPVKGVTKIGNMIAAFIMIVAINLLISAFFLLGLYLLKSALDIDLLPGHFSDQLERFN